MPPRCLYIQITGTIIRQLIVRLKGSKDSNLGSKTSKKKKKIRFRGEIFWQLGYKLIVLRL
jgi:hypothetical protein